MTIGKKPAESVDDQIAALDQRIREMEQKRTQLDADRLKRFGDEAVAEALAADSDVSQVALERAQAESEVGLLAAAIEGLRSQKVALLEQKRRVRLADMTRQRNELQTRRAALLKRSDEMQIARDQIEREARSLFSQISQYDRALAQMTAA